MRKILTTTPSRVVYTLFQETFRHTLNTLVGKEKKNLITHTYIHTHFIDAP